MGHGQKNGKGESNPEPSTDTDSRPYKAVDVFHGAVGAGPIMVFLLLASEKSRNFLSRPG